MTAPRAATASNVLTGEDLVHEMRNKITIVRANVEAFIDKKLEPTTERLQAIVLALRRLDANLTDLRSRLPLRWRMGLRGSPCLGRVRKYYRRTRCR